MALSLPNPGQVPWATELNEALEQIDAQTVVDGEIVGDNLFLVRNDGSLLDAGNVRGPVGPTANSDPAIAGFISAPGSDSGEAVLDVVEPVVALLDTRKMQALDWTVEPSQWGGPVGAGLNLPTHVTPATNQVTHPSVLHFPDGWNGYKYWMAYTPYPGNNDDHEDPNLAVSNDGINWIHAPGVTQPLDDQTGTPYNSDPDLVMGPNNTMYLFWRFYDSGLGTNQEKVYVRTSTNGVTWTPKALVWQFTETTLRTLSPSFVFENNKWTAWFVDQQSTTRTFKKRVSTTASPTGGWGAATTMTVSPVISGKDVWHVEVRKIGGRYIGILNVINPGAGGIGGLLQLIASNDGNTWVASAESIIPRVKGTEHNSLYRASFFPEVKDGLIGLRVYYGAFQDTPSPYVWNIFRTWVGPSGRGTPVTVTAGSGFTITNQKLYRRGNWVIGTFDWSHATGLTHGATIATLPSDCAPVTNDTAVSLVTPAATPINVVISEAGLIQGNNPPASKTSGTVRIKTPILPT